VGTAEGSHPPDVSEGVNKDVRYLLGGTRIKNCFCFILNSCLYEWRQSFIPSRVYGRGTHYM